MKSQGSYNLKVLSRPFAIFFTFMFFFLSENFVMPSAGLPELLGDIETDDDFDILQPEIISGEDYLIIPFKMAGRLLMIDAVIDGQSGNLIFDTGATGIVMNQTYFRKNTLMNREKSNGITGAVGNVSMIAIGCLKVSDLELTKFCASVADLSHIENQKGVKVLGLFGFKMIKNFEIVIDVNRQVLQLFKIDSKGNRITSTAPPFVAEYTQKFDTFKNILFVRGMIAGREMKFCLDTGAETNAISSNESKSVLNTISITGRSSLQGVGSAQSKVLVGTLTDFRFGDHSLGSMSAIITNLDALCEAYDTSLDGMLGYDFLKKGTFCINFVKKQMGVIYARN